LAAISFQGIAKGAMATADFWRDLDPYPILRADWDYRVKPGEKPPPVANWRLVGTDQKSRSIRFGFEALARRAGPEVHPYMDSLTGWLEALRQSQLNNELAGPGVEQEADGTIIAHVYFGTIQAVCEASADLCKAYESIALETERLLRVAEEGRSRAQQQRATHEAAFEDELAKIRGSSQPKLLDKQPPADDRRASVDAFLARCNEHSKTRIRRKHIWLSVGHSKPRQFEYWQASSPKATAEDETNFERVLKMAPTAFLALLGQKQLLD
jgi:hypothetical protein